MLRTVKQVDRREACQEADKPRHDHKPQVVIYRQAGEYLEHAATPPLVLKAIAKTRSLRVNEPRAPAFARFPGEPIPTAKCSPRSQKGLCSTYGRRRRSKSSSLPRSPRPSTGFD